MSGALEPNTFQHPNICVDRLSYFLTPEEEKVLNKAVREIMGWHDRKDRHAHIALSVFVDGKFNRAGERLCHGCGLGISATRKALASLDKFRVLLKVGDATQDGQLFYLQEDATAIDWQSLEARRVKWDEKNATKAAKARKKRGVLCDNRGIVAQQEGGVIVQEGGGVVAQQQGNPPLETHHETQNTPAATAPEGFSSMPCSVCRTLIHYREGEKVKCYSCGADNVPPGGASLPQPPIPRRVQRSRKKGAKLPPNTICVTRGTRWGNPIKVGDDDIPDAATAVNAHRCHLCGSLAAADLEALVEPLRGKNLACWCKPGDPCHADTWLELAAMTPDGLHDWWYSGRTGTLPAPRKAQPTGDDALDATFGPRLELAEVKPSKHWLKREASAAANPHVAEMERQLERFGDKANALRVLEHKLEVDFGLDPPWEKPKKLRYWFKALEEAIDAAGGDAEIVLAAAKRLRKNEMTLAGPQSLTNTARAIAAEKRSKNNGRGSSGTSRITATPTAERKAEIARNAAALCERDSRRAAEKAGG